MSKDYVKIGFLLTLCESKKYHYEINDFSFVAFAIIPEWLELAAHDKIDVVIERGKTIVSVISYDDCE